MPNLIGTASTYNSKRASAGNVGLAAGNTILSLRDAIVSQGGPGYTYLNEQYAWIVAWAPYAGGGGVDQGGGGGAGGGGG